MKTPIQELIEQLEDLRDSISEDDAMYRGGVINSIRLAEGMLEREKEVFNGDTIEEIKEEEAEVFKLPMYHSVLFEINKQEINF